MGNVGGGVARVGNMGGSKGGEYEGVSKGQGIWGGGVSKGGEYGGGGSKSGEYGGVARVGNMRGLARVREYGGG